jgi:hypothetical protein
MHAPWYLWPFLLVFGLIEWIIRLTGRMVAAIIGFVFMIVGLVLTLTLIALPLGLPLLVFGLLLALRGVF